MLICETVVDGNDRGAVAVAIQLALQVIQEGERHLFHPDPWDPEIYENVQLSARHGRRTVKAELSVNRFEVEVVDRNRARPIRMVIGEDEPEFRIRSPGDVTDRVISRLQQWFEAVEQPTEPSAPSVCAASRLHVERIATAAAHVFYAAFKAVEVLPSLCGPDLRLRLHGATRSIDFLGHESVYSAHGAMSPELSRLFLIEPAWARWRLTAIGRDERRRCALIDIERPRSVVIQGPRPSPIAAMRLIADHLPAEARLLWDGSETAPAGLLD